MKKRMRVWLIVAIIVVVVLVVAGASICWWKMEAREYCVQGTQTNLIDWDRVKVGDKFGGLTIASVSGLGGTKIDEDNVHIKFTGETEVTGSYFYGREDAGNRSSAWFSVDYALSPSFPREKQQDQKFGFYLTPEEKAVQFLGIENKKAKIVIKDYNIMYAGMKMMNEATFVKEVK